MEAEAARVGSEMGPQAPWHVVSIRSHCERVVSEQLEVLGLHPFLPTTQVWSERRGFKGLELGPMFPGYLFVNDALDQFRQALVLNARGVVRILREGWDRLAEVPEREMDAVLRLSALRCEAIPHPFLGHGPRIRILSGPLAGLEGILVRSQHDSGLLVLSVRLLRRSVAVHVDWTEAAPLSSRRLQPAA